MAQYILQIIFFCINLATFAVGESESSSEVPAEPKKRLIKVRPGEPAKWMDEDEILELRRKHIGGIDLTPKEIQGRDMFPADFVPTTPQRLFPTPDYPTSASQEEMVKSAIGKLRRGNLREIVKTLSDFHTRAAFREKGYTPAPEQWLDCQIKFILKAYPQVKSTLFKGLPYHEDPTGQQNILVTLEGTDPSLKEEIVILGAHHDSKNIDKNETRAPGADDNATGVAALLEVLRVILEAGLVPKRTVEFHWYMGEEEFILGSNAVSDKYHREGKHVVAMLNLDCLGYLNGEDDKVVGIYTDIVNPKLTRFIEVLATAYLDYKWKNSECKYYCSDHVWWDYYKYPSALAAEVTFNPYFHTVNDTIDKVSFEKVNEFVKLAVAYVVETAQFA